MLHLKNMYFLCILLCVSSVYLILVKSFKNEQMLLVRELLHKNFTRTTMKPLNNTSLSEVERKTTKHTNHTKKPAVPVFGELFKFSKNKELQFRTKIDFTPTACPNSIQKKFMNFKWTSRIFLANITLAMHQGAMSLEEYKRLHVYGMPFGFRFRDDLSYKDLQEVLANIPREDSIFDFQGSERPTCISCAVVGNGGILNGSKLGKEIDSHDFVFRVNNGIRRGFETDVGNRTTHYVMMDRSLTHTPKEDVPRDKGIKYVFLPCRRLDYTYIKNAIGPPNPELKLNTDPQNMRILHPDFVRYVQKVWMKIKAFRPTTGGMMLMTALHSGCDIVDVYGMGYTAQYSSHYYEKTYNKFFVYHRSHDYKREIKLLRMLDKDRIITWYKRDVNEFLIRKKDVW